MLNVSVNVSRMKESTTTLLLFSSSTNASIVTLNDWVSRRKESTANVFVSSAFMGFFAFFDFF